MIAEQQSTRAQIGRILESETFNSSPVLRHLFTFLAEKALSGEGEAIKEYTIAIEGLGKPVSYDPHRDSTVRIQVGRLRQKLAEYYRLEGVRDPLLIEVPKGRLGLECKERFLSTEIVAKIEEGLGKPEPLPESSPNIPQKVASSSGFAIQLHTLVLVMLLLASLIWAALVTLTLRRERSITTAQAAWTPEVAQLWEPFVDQNRPVLLSIAAPLFVGFQGEGFFRDVSLDRWDDVLKSQKIETIQKSLGGPGLVARHYYTGFGDAEAAFAIGKLLGIRQPELFLARSDRLTWRQLSNNNVIFVGPPQFFDEQLRELVRNPEFKMDRSGIINLHPRQNEPVALQDLYPAIQKAGSPATSDDGKIYVLVTDTPGPMGKSEVRIFNCNHNPGAAAAVQWFTNPQFAKLIVTKLRTVSGSIPHAFQLVLEVQFKDSVPTQVSYVMHRELRNPAAVQTQGLN